MRPILASLLLTGCMSERELRELNKRQCEARQCYPCVQPVPHPLEEGGVARYRDPGEAVTCWQSFRGLSCIRDVPDAGGLP